MQKHTEHVALMTLDMHVSKENMELQKHVFSLFIIILWYADSTQMASDISGTHYIWGFLDY